MFEKTLNESIFRKLLKTYLTTFVLPDDVAYYILYNMQKYFLTPNNRI